MRLFEYYNKKGVYLACVVFLQGDHKFMTFLTTPFLWRSLKDLNILQYGESVLLGFFDVRSVAGKWGL